MIEYTILKLIEISVNTIIYAFGLSKELASSNLVKRNNIENLKE